MAYHVLHSFEGPPGDGDSPVAGLIDVTGQLYATTPYGGANCTISRYRGGCGTVYVITTGGKEKVLYSFRKGTDGRYPYSNLLDVGGVLYGTTRDGGKQNKAGTVFSITTNGVEKILHSFGAGADGSRPFGGLIDINGTFYGTTVNGGDYKSCTNGCGTVFSITTGGVEKVLHSFGKGSDGSEPESDLINVAGTLYGTTFNGGAYTFGTVFSITTDGTERVLHSFGNGTEGRYPSAGLLDVHGTLYGTTSQGGAQRGAYTYGTVFRVTTGGVEKVLHSFDKRTDGSFPGAGLIDLSGMLYGTTPSGGEHKLGTVFSITTGGQEKVLHSFATGTDGNQPEAGLIKVNGTLYGTTSGGGTSNNGTVFSITP